jgi:hypothetical protein
MSNRRKGHIYWHDDWKKMKQEVKTEQNKVLWLEMSDPFPLNPYPTHQNHGKSMKMKTDIECPKCNKKMEAMTSCHLFCPNCGSHLDCSDKGNFW